jgi:hypothetical protein
MLDYADSWRRIECILHCDMNMSILGAKDGILWFGYEVFPQKAYVSKPKSAADGVILGGFGNFEGWSLTKGSRPMGADLCRYLGPCLSLCLSLSLSLCFFLSLYFLSAMR